MLGQRPQNASTHFGTKNHAQYAWQHDMTFQLNFEDPKESFKLSCVILVMSWFWLRISLNRKMPQNISTLCDASVFQKYKLMCEGGGYSKPAGKFFMQFEK